MGDTQQFKHRSSAILWVILLVTISLQVIGTASHHHSAADHYQQRTQEWRLHQQRQALEGKPPHELKEQSTSNKSSKLWLLNSNPDQHHPRSINDGWAFREWHNHLVTTQQGLATTTTTTPRTTLAKTPFPSLWNYAPKRGPVQQHNRQNHNSTATRELSPKHGWDLNKTMSSNKSKKKWERRSISNWILIVIVVDGRNINCAWVATGWIYCLEICTVV